jgi:hypothetical protein
MITATNWTLVLRADVAYMLSYMNNMDNMHINVCAKVTTSGKELPKSSGDRAPMFESLSIRKTRSLSPSRNSLQ